MECKNCHFSFPLECPLFEQIEGEVESAAFKATRDLGHSPLKPEQLQAVCTVCVNVTCLLYYPWALGKAYVLPSYRSSTITFICLVSPPQTHDWYCCLLRSGNRGRRIDVLSTYNANASIHNYPAQFL